LCDETYEAMHPTSCPKDEAPRAPRLCLDVDPEFSPSRMLALEDAPQASPGHPGLQDGLEEDVEAPTVLRNVCCAFVGLSCVWPHPRGNVINLFACRTSMALYGTTCAQTKR
jgi:hypothetical protein